MPFKQYLASVTRALKAGNATEHTYRPALQALIQSLAKGVTATNEPKRVACGAPDFIVANGPVPVGYIEAKDIGKSLDEVQDDEQLKRYRTSLRNLVLTDYLEFRYFRNGEPVTTARIARVQKNGVVKADPEGIAQAEQLFSWFFQAKIESVGTPRELAHKMAAMARMIRDLIAKIFTAEAESGELHAQYEGFRQVLIADLSHAQFADMYAQTICYGLFAARCNHVGSGFSREAAARELPKTNPFLRKVFQQIAGIELDDRIAWAVDDLALLLGRADISSILENFGKRTRQEDPVVHFYETFLAAYDPKLRETRGVYYTPEPVVSYIVRSVDSILTRDFSLKEGLADSSKIKVRLATGKKQRNKKGEQVETRIDQEFHRVQILDPATGTGTFLYQVIDQIRERFKGNAGMWPTYVAKHLLPRLYGFELLMAPYAVAHMKLGLQLQESGYDFASDERLRVYLTNTLEEAHELTGLPLFAQVIAHEAASASEVKKDAPIMVVLGNPPYSGHSANKGKWIQGLLDDYKRSPELKKPAQAKWLSDDYVKFIRFAQWRIEQTGYGVLAFISNHGYLDNPTFKDMRESLIRTFDNIYILDLHGSSKKKEKAPDGSADKNVFDIQQGVSIGVFVKNTKRPAAPQVLHSEIWGTREAKYSWLLEHSIENTSWTSCTPRSPDYLFVPKDEVASKEYMIGWSLKDIFSPNGDPASGVVTTHDEFAISWAADEAADKVERVLATENEGDARELFRLCTTNQWSYEKAKQELPNQDWRSEIATILYRPFDVRWTVYNRHVAVHRRERVFEHVLGKENYVLISARSNKSQQPDHFFVSRIPSETKCGEATTQSQAFPLYLYPSSKRDLFEDAAPSTGPGGRRPNLAPAFVEAVSKKLKIQFIADGAGDLRKTWGPEDLFFYMYAMFFSLAYRTRFASFLKLDYPRLPVTSDLGVFISLSKLGKRLVSLHLMDEFGTTVSRYPIAGKNEIMKVKFVSDAERLSGQQPFGASNAGRIYINDEQYFEGIPENVWNYHIGGYQICEKWLKDRKGRLLSFDDLTHYQRVVSALAETIRIQGEIDEAIPSWPIA